MWRPRRLAPPSLLCLLLLAACTTSPASAPRTASAPRVQASRPPATPSPNASSAWVLSTVGLNLRSAPDTGSQKLTTLAWGARLTILERRAGDTGTGTWLHVATESGQLQGWVLDDPALLIHRPVAQHVEALYSNLFPSEWALQSGNPALMTSPAGSSEAVTWLIQTADDPAKLPAPPLQTGKELRNESPIDVYGVTTYLTVYSVDSGGFEFAVKFKSGATAYFFDWRQGSGSSPDDRLFKTLLGSVILAR